MKYLVIFLGIVAVGAMFAMGCHGEDNGTPPPPVPSQAQFDLNMQKVQNDPNIPEDKKAQAVAGMKAAYEAQKAAMANASKGRPGGAGSH